MTNSIVKMQMSRWLEYALWVAGIVLIGTFALAKAQSSVTQSDAIAILEDNWRVAAAVAPSTALWSENRVSTYTAASADKRSPLGLLSISSVGVRVAVFNGVGEDVLKVGAGRVPGTATIAGDGNLAIAAHRDGFFRSLKDIEVGDEIAVRHDGGTNRYVVTALSVVDPSDVSVLAPTATPALTLITCYPFYFVGDAPQRFIVRAEIRSPDTA